MCRDFTASMSSVNLIAHLVSLFQSSALPVLQRERRPPEDRAACFLSLEGGRDMAREEQKEREGSLAAAARPRKKGESFRICCRRRARKLRLSFGRRCRLLAAEQRARFYILRRCIVMLVCWSDSCDP
ncbi:hypothetical protein AXF42_Ash015791 [Apostasia shenzhenica]|uniref:Uncharacterized protein n=1 Tax=Apostasia shenzhenica TaxID=1088818 RepID=A0A2H9ZXJ5_9ASPA|nr:hypothetical protein AXF42_Ash015791 [Apostasia shenzhenica]